MQDDQAFSVQILEEVKTTYSGYILKGASSLPTIVVPASAAAYNLDPSARA